MWHVAARSILATVSLPVRRSHLERDVKLILNYYCRTLMLTEKSRDRHWHRYYTNLRLPSFTASFESAQKARSLLLMLMDFGLTDWLLVWDRHWLPFPGTVTQLLLPVLKIPVAMGNNSLLATNLDSELISVDLVWCHVVTFISFISFMCRKCVSCTQKRSLPSWLVYCLCSVLLLLLSVLLWK